jgi:cytochrome c peroxidase
MQTPLLVGLLTRAPYMHDGCAGDLHEAVLACGVPANHGGAALLGAGELDDLVAYLRTR